MTMYEVYGMIKSSVAEDYYNRTQLEPRYTDVFLAESLERAILLAFKRNPLWYSAKARRR